MQRAVHTRFFRLIYGSPERSDINCGVNIRIHIVSAVWTLERLVLSCANMMATGTSLRSVSRFNDNKINAMQSGFILKKGTQLAERPAAEFSPELLVPSFGREPNVSQVLDSDPLVFGFRRKNNPLCDSVVNDCRRSSFFALKPFRQSSTVPPCGSFRSVCLCLNRTTNPLPLLTVLIESIGGMFDPVRSDDNVCKPEVNTYKLFNIFNFPVWNIDSLEKVKLSLVVNQIRFPFDVWDIFRVVANKRNFQPSSDSPDGYGKVFIGENTTVISDSPDGSERPLSFLIQLIGIRYFAYAAHEHLSGKIKGGLESVVAKIMDFELIKNFVFPCNVGNGITNSVCFFHRLKKQTRLFLGRQKFYFQCQFHKANIIQTFENSKDLFKNLSTCKEQDITTLKERGFLKFYENRKKTN